MSDLAVASHSDRDSPDSGRSEQAPRRLVGLALLAGLILEVGLRGGLANAMVLNGFVLVVLVLCSDRRLRRREAQLLAVAAIVPTAFLAVRASPWLAWSNVAAATALLTASVLYSRSGSILDATPTRLAQRGGAAIRRGIGGLAVVRVLVPDAPSERLDRLGRIGRALLVALPVLAVLVALLASADAVFASLLTPDVDVGPLAGHVVLAVLLAPVVLMLAAAAVAPKADERRAGTFGVTEAVTMLLLAAVVLTLFVVSQLVALTGAGQRLVDSAGLTPAEYARSGFFQLSWATALLLGFLTLVRALATPECLRHRAVVVLGAAVPVMALGLVGVSLRRMALYDQAFGLTMLRLWVVGAAVWMGIVLVMTAARNLGLAAQRDWLVAGAGLAAVALIVLADVADPEAFVARHNIDRARAGAELDIVYLAELSDDAVPAIVHGLSPHGVPEEDAPLLLAALRCDGDATGVAALNVAAARATDLRRALCPG